MASELPRPRSGCLSSGRDVATILGATEAFSSPRPPPPPNTTRPRRQRRRRRMRRARSEAAREGPPSPPHRRGRRRIYLSRRGSPFPVIAIRSRGTSFGFGKFRGDGAAGRRSRWASLLARDNEDGEGAGSSSLLLRGARPPLPRGAGGRRSAADAMVTDYWEDETGGDARRREWGPIGTIRICSGPI